MLSGLLITLNILVCIALIGVVLMQRSEGGALGSGGNPGGLITARGAGDLLTRTTWILFGLFLVLSLGLTLLGAHDKANSSLASKLKQETANVAALNQKAATNGAEQTGQPGQAPGGAPAALAPPPTAPTTAPVTAPPVTASAPAAATPTKPTKAQAAHAVPGKPAAQAPAAATPAAATPTAPPPAPVLIAPPPQPVPQPSAAAPSTKPEPKSDPNAPVSTGTP